MAGQEMFKGALGWDDWIWWSGIGGLGLLLLMLVLCCIVCVQRAKRKGRAEALAAVHSRERERQQQEQAQLRYAQAQQARYPNRESSYKFSKPEPPQPTYNPYGQDDHTMHGNSFLNNAPVPRQKPRRGSQQTGVQQEESQSYQPHRPQQHQQPYYSAPPVQQHQQQYMHANAQPEERPSQHYMYANTQPEERQQQQQELEELPQVAAYYGRQPKPQPEKQHQVHQPTGPVMSQQYHRQQQVNPSQPPIMMYRKTSARSDSTGGGGGGGPSFVLDDDTSTSQHDAAPFVQVTTPRKNNSSVSTSSAAPAGYSQPQQSAPGYAGYEGRGSAASSASSSMLRVGAGAGAGGTTLRDRIDALRDGSSSQGLSTHESFTRVSGGSNASSGYAPTHSQVAPPPPPPPPAAYQHHASPQPRASHKTVTVVSSNDTLSSSSHSPAYGNSALSAFDEEAFNTARSGQFVAEGATTATMRTRRDSGRSIESLGVDDEYPARDRTNTAGSTGSIEF